MLKALQQYVANETVITATDMNTLGTVVEMLRGLSGEGVFVDANSIAFRRLSRDKGPLLVKVTAGGGTNGLTWAEANAPTGTNPATLKTGGLTSTALGGGSNNGAWEANSRAAGATNGTGDLFTLLETRTDSNGASVRTFFGGSLDFYNGGTGSGSTSPVFFAGFINVGTSSGASNVFQYTSETIRGNTGARFEFKLPITDGNLLQASSGSVGWLPLYFTE